MEKLQIWLISKWKPGPFKNFLFLEYIQFQNVYKQRELPAVAFK